MSARQYYVMQGSSLSGHESLKTGLGTGKTIAPQKKRYPLCHAFYTLHKGFLQVSVRFAIPIVTMGLQSALPSQASQRNGL